MLGVLQKDRLSFEHIFSDAYGRDIREMLEGLGKGVPSFGQTYIDSQGKSQPEFLLPFEEAMCLVSGGAPGGAGYRVEADSGLDLQGHPRHRGHSWSPLGQEAFKRPRSHVKGFWLPWHYLGCFRRSWGLLGAFLGPSGL